MRKILVIGDEGFFKDHLSFWLKHYRAEFDFVKNNNFPQKDFYETVLFFRESELYNHDKKSLEDFFMIHLEALHHALINSNSNHFIYIDFTSGVINPHNKLYKKLKRLSLEMIKSYCDFVNKHYTIIYMYDLIGYKYNTVFRYHINNILENSRVFKWEGSYENIHLVFIHDAMKAIYQILIRKDKQKTNKEVHIRYDNVGISVKKIVEHFQNVNKNVWKIKPLEYIDISNNKKTAPFFGNPYELLKNEYPMDEWVRIKKHQDFF